MYKDFDLKNDPQYHSEHLRGKILKSIKHLHDETDEVKQPSAKKLAFIPVTGSNGMHKYTDNKSWEKL